MASFCKQCSMDTFGWDFKDLAGISKPEDEAQGLFPVVICEGCGVIQVDSDGKCVSPDCLCQGRAGHGKAECQANQDIKNPTTGEVIAKSGEKL